MFYNICIDTTSDKICCLKSTKPHIKTSDNMKHNLVSAWNFWNFKCKNRKYSSLNSHRIIYKKITTATTTEIGYRIYCITTDKQIFIFYFLNSVTYDFLFLCYFFAPRKVIKNERKQMIDRQSKEKKIAEENDNLEHCLSQPNIDSRDVNNPQRHL